MKGNSAPERGNSSEGGQGEGRGSSGVKEMKGQFGERVVGAQAGEEARAGPRRALQALRGPYSFSQSNGKPLEALNRAYTQQLHPVLQ